MTNVWAGQHHNVEKTIDDWTASRAAVIGDAEQAMTAITQSECYKNYLKWFAEKWEERPTPKMIAACDLPLTKHATRAMQVHAFGGTGRIFEKKLFVKKEQVQWSRALFELQFFGFGPGAEATSAAPYGLAEGRVLLTGSMFILGIRMDYKRSYQQQIATIKTMSGSNLGDIAQAPENFYMKLVPSGYLLVLYSCEKTTGLRWGLFTNLPDEHAVVLKSAQAIVDAYPKLNSGPYASWIAHLMSDDRSHEGAEVISAAA